MSILSQEINNYDPLFLQMWRAEAISWETRNEVDDVCMKIMSEMEKEGDMWARLINVSAATAQYYGFHSKAPAEYVVVMEEMVAKFRELFKRILPEWTHVSIEYFFKLQGSKKFIPTLCLRLDTKPFCTYRSSKAGYAKLQIHLGHKATNYPGYRSSRKDPLPTPTFDDYIDTEKNPRSFNGEEGWVKFKRYIDLYDNLDGLI